MNYYNEIKNKLVDNEIRKKVREQINNRNDLTAYYEVGKLLNDAGKHYGEGIIKNYSIKLQDDIGKKYSERTLRSMRQLYILFEEEKWKPVDSILSWSQYIILMRIKNKNEMYYYMEQAKRFNLSKRELETKIKDKEYKRLNDKTKFKLIIHDEEEIADFLKEPIILNKNKNYERISEVALKEIILNDLDNFLKQLGNGFCYIEQEYKIKIGNTYNFIDILLFNYIFNAFIVVELKITELKKEHIGQIEVYMNYIDQNIKNINHNKTIGIIVCRINNKYLIRYSSDTRIHVTTYEIC